MNAQARYTTPALALHWLMALLLLAALCIGPVMTALPISPLRLRLFNWHKWIGVTLLGLALLRLLWRLRHAPPPALPMPRWQRGLACGVHAALYALFFGVPLAGWAYSSAAGFPVVLFGVWPLPDFVPVDRGLADRLKTLHHLLAYALAAGVALHLGAVFKHHFIDGDATVKRMMPG